MIINNKILDKENYNFIDKIEAINLFKLQKKFIKSYINKNDELELKKWLQKIMEKELPEKSKKEIENISKIIVERVELNQKNKESIKVAKQKGISNEQWFAKEVKKVSKVLGVTQMGNYLQKVDKALLEANTALYDTVINNNGNINQNPNLDGFIAEVYKANTFNIDAAINDKEYYAEVIIPKPGQRYSKNSLDGQIRDYTKNGKPVRRYQEKFGKDAKATKKLFKKGDYRGQRKGVPADQVDQIEGSEAEWKYKDIKGKGLTKKEAKKIQKKAQNGEVNSINNSWNDITLKKIAKNVAKKSAFAGVASAGISAGYEIMNKAIKNEKIKNDEVFNNAIKAGVDTGCMVALSGAVKVAAEKGMLKIIPKGTPGGTIANMVFIGIENAKILGEISTGELSIKKGLNKMEEISTSTALGTFIATKGTVIGAKMGGVALSWIPFVGTGVGAGIGGVVGASVSYMAGSEIGKAAIKTTRKVRKKAKNVAKKVVETGEKVVKKINNAAKSTFNSLKSSGKNICKSISKALGF